MRISTAQIFQSSTRTILDQQASISYTQAQLGTGRKILTPADDPAGAAKILELTKALSVNEQFQRNADAAEGRLSREENALVGVENILRRVSDLAIQGNNDSQSPGSRRDITTELRQRIDELIGLANTKDANGEYLFAGFQANTQPFARASGGGFSYAGDQGQRFMQISPSSQVADGDSGADVFQLIRNGNGTFTTLDNANNNGTGIIDPGRVTDNGAYVRDTYTINFPFQTVAGSTLTFNDVNANDTLAYTLDINGTTVYTVDETGTPVSSLAALAGVINDDSGATGVRAIVNGTTLYLTSTTPSTSDITVTETLSGFTPGDGDTIAGYFGGALNGDTGASDNTVFSPDDATVYLIEDAAGNIETVGAYQEDAFINFQGIQTLFKGNPMNGDQFTLSPSLNQDLFTTMENLVTALESPSGLADDRARLHNQVNRVLADIRQAETSLSQVRARVGGRMQVIEGERVSNDAASFQMKSVLSNIQDLDIAEAASRFNMQLISLQAAQQAFVRVQGLNLFNFL